jgi:DNA-binding transcriptional ArsR family regulator
VETYQGSFEALGDRTRWAIVERLARGPQSVRQLADGLPVSRQAVSQHLKVLGDAGLVTSVPEGTRRIYRLDPAAIESMRASLDRLWGDALAAFAAAAHEHEHEHEEER